MTNYTQELKDITERFLVKEDKAALTDDLHYLLSRLQQEAFVDQQQPVSLTELLMPHVDDPTEPDAEYSPLPTGMGDFDFFTSGLRRGELVIVGARPGMGKTTFMVQLCVNWASSGISCGFISLDISGYLLGKRFVSNVTGISLDSLLGKIQMASSANIRKANEYISGLPVYAYAHHFTNLHLLLEQCRRLVREKKVQSIFIDYLQLMSTGNRRMNRDAELAMITRELKKLAMELNVVIIAASQLSRQVENRPGYSKRPQISDLRESGAIEQDADKVIFLYRPEYYGMEVDENNRPTRRKMEILVAKNKFGPCFDTVMQCTDNMSGLININDDEPGIHFSANRLNDLF